MDKVIEFASAYGPGIAASVITYGSYAALVGSIYYGGKSAFEKSQEYWIEAKPNEWLLVIRNGELLKCNVGLATWIWPGDAAVKFPSALCKLHFTAEQVTAEMQGVEVKGMLVWTIHRDKEGPFKCYKAFGDDLKRKEPIEANSQLQQMAVSIIRDRIANLTINDILKNRQKLRNGVKDEMQKLLTGWGIWLETCEIQDVKIASRSLFANLQMEFREKSRQEAEKISADTNNVMREEELVRSNEFSKITAESQTKASIFAAEQRLQVQKQEATLHEQRLKIEKKKAEAENKKKIRDAEMAIELAKKRIQLNGDNEVFRIKQNTAQEAQQQKLNQVRYETEQSALDNELAKTKKREDKELLLTEKTLAIKEKGYTENVLKAMVLDTQKDIYRQLRIDSMKVVNVGGGSG